MSLSDWSHALFGAQARLAVWWPLVAYLAWAGLVHVCGVRSPRARFWSLLALFGLLPLVFLVPILTAMIHPDAQVGSRLVSIPDSFHGSNQQERGWYNQIPFIWPFLVIPLGMVCALTLGILEYIVAAVRLWFTPKCYVNGVFVLETPGLVAFTFGLVRPRVFVSRAVWNGPHRQAVLAHERAHVRRRDPLVFFWVRAIRRSTLYLPFGGRLYRTLHLEAERACDEAGVRAVGVKAYATALLDFADATTRGTRALGAIPTALSFGVPEWVGVLALLPVLQLVATRLPGGWIAGRVRLLVTKSTGRERLGLFWLGFVVVYAVILRLT